MKMMNDDWPYHSVSANKVIKQILSFKALMIISLFSSITQIKNLFSHNSISTEFAGCDKLLAKIYII